MAACAGRADGNAPAVDEVGFREARAVASMAGEQGCLEVAVGGCAAAAGGQRRGSEDRKSTRLNSSHSQISYAVFCLKKKKTAKHAWHCATRTRCHALYTHT